MCLILHIAQSRIERSTSKIMVHGPGGASISWCSFGKTSSDALVAHHLRLARSEYLQSLAKSYQPSFALQLHQKLPSELFGPHRRFCLLSSHFAAEVNLT